MIQVALIQMCATGTKEANLSLIRRMVGEAVEGARKLDVVCLPEYCYGVPTADTSRDLAESIPGNYSEEMATLAERYKVNLSAGSFAGRGVSGSSPWRSSL